MKYLTMIAWLITAMTALPGQAADRPASHLAGRHNVTLCIESDQGVPQYVAGQLAEQTRRGTEVSATLKFLSDHRDAYRMDDPGKELVVRRAEEDRLGNQHVRFKQYYEGVRVVGGDLVSHFDTDGVLKLINGFYRPDIDLNPAPAVTSSHAVSVSAADFQGFYGRAEAEELELVIFPWQSTYYLTWRVLLQADSPLGRWEYYIDAATGQIIFKTSMIKGSEEIGTGYSVLGRTRNHIDVWYTGTTYEMRDYTRQLNNNIHGHNGQMPDGNVIQTCIAGADLPGLVAADADNIWSATMQRPAVDAHVYTGVFYDWLLRELGRNSYDNNGSSMYSSVNWTGDQYGAYWTGRRTVYPIWGPYTRSWASGLDVVAHEWAHGITDYCGILVYRWESGALNEAFSNMIGVAFEFAHDTLDPPDWYCGENAYVYGNGIWSMSNPEEFNHPSYYEGPYWMNLDGCVPTEANDFCGVHSNCGVGHKWFYLLSDGDTFRNVTVNGIGVENAVKIAYHANAYYWTPMTNYRDAAIGTYFAAMDLDGTGVWAEEVVNAWLAVNVDFPDAELSFEFPLGTPASVLMAQPTLIEVNVSGFMGGDPVAGSGRIHYSVDHGEYVSADMTEVSENSYQATLPALLCDQTVEYYVSAEESASGNISYPDPSAPFIAVVADSTVVEFEDDFETDKGWTVSGDAISGHWERGVPVTTDVIGSPTEDYDGSGQCYVTGNAPGDSDVDGGITNLVSPVFDLEGTDGLVSYARWYHNRCDPGLIAGDMLYCYISNDDGQSWTLTYPITGPNPYFEGHWEVAEFVVSDFVAPTSQMRLRFQTSDLYLPTCSEAAVDAVEIRKYVCNCCKGLTGNVDNDLFDIVDIGDLTALIDFLFITYEQPACMKEGNIDGDIDGLVDIGDLTALIDFLYITFETPSECN
ncbi:MAG: peptidase M4 family protein [Candidatus Zixiibacteriota bacterium]|nr:MAG: peptidase M4 family protein [candidate division Zixibacteria bacterium]